jgi:hypothetical protein
MKKPAEQTHSGTEPQPNDKAEPDRLPSKRVDFPERNDDPEQARDLERQQDA